MVAVDERVAVGFIPRISSDPARRLQIFWNLIGSGVSCIFMVIGAGYAVGGSRAIASNTLHLLQNIEDPIGGLHAHGFIMMGLAMFLAHGMGDYRRRTRLALQAVAFYSSLTAVLIFGGWFFYAVSFGGPWWYLFTAFLSVVLLIMIPSLPPAHRRRRQYRGVGRSERA